eukprot:4111197-Ditylum_brightwellii.AAC.1
MTNDLVQHIEQNGVQCSNHLKDVVFDPIRSGIVSLTEAGNQMNSHSQDVIPNLTSDVDNIENPRKDVMDGFNRQVKEVAANLSSGQEKIQMMAKKQ